ncbi:MAG: hypothetical protein AB7H48_03355 [Parachlamydiales bacterium]
MKFKDEISSKKVIEFLQRKRRYGRSLTGEELAKFLERSLLQETENMSSEALQSTSAFRTSLEGDMF